MSTLNGKKLSPAKVRALSTIRAAGGVGTPIDGYQDFTRRTALSLQKDGLITMTWMKHSKVFRCQITPEGEKLLEWEDSF